jgi:hypothetical protein
MLQGFSLHTIKKNLLVCVQSLGGLELCQYVFPASSKFKFILDYKTLSEAHMTLSFLSAQGHPEYNIATVILLGARNQTHAAQVFGAHRSATVDLTLLSPLTTRPSAKKSTYEKDVT